jgi:hypothetical protein
MRKQTRLLATLAALATVGLVGCLNNADFESADATVLPTETSALIAFASDSTRPHHARARACSVLTELVAARADTADTTVDDSAATGLENAVQRVCGPRVKPPRSPMCDSLHTKLFSADTTIPGYDSLYALYQSKCVVRPDTLKPDTSRPDTLAPKPPKPPKPDTVRPDTVKPVRPDTVKPVRPDTVKSDSLRPVPPAKPDSGFTRPREPVKPQPPKKPVKDTAVAEE